MKASLRSASIEFGGLFAAKDGTTVTQPWSADSWHCFKDVVSSCRSSFLNILFNRERQGEWPGNKSTLMPEVN